MTLLTSIPSDWLWGLAGGLLIGTAAAFFLLTNGRIMGASGVLGGLVDGSDSGRWRENAAFVAGLVLVPGLVWALAMPEVSTNISPNLAVVIAGGLLVGIGTRIANGCTSGHGVCGISRLSFRGLIATVFYLLAGGLTVVLFKHVLGVI
jgi:Predicted transporter component